MAALAAGALVRVLDGPPVLFAGTVIAGGAIAIGNVLLPPLIKRDFPDRSGLMMGVYFALGLDLFVLRTERVVDTARVSAMAQSIGYTLCAFGPLLVGLLHNATGSWTPPLVLLLALLGPQVVCGALAGRNRTVRA